MEATFAKREGNCTVVTVDGAQPGTGWKCRCFVVDGVVFYSVTGPSFGGRWVGPGPSDGANTNLPVTDPTDGTIYFLKLSCTK